MDAELTQRLISDSKVLMSDAEELIKATASQIKPRGWLIQPSGVHCSTEFFLMKFNS